MGFKATVSATFIGAERTITATAIAVSKAAAACALYAADAQADAEKSTGRTYESLVTEFLSEDNRQAS